MTRTRPPTPLELARRERRRAECAAIAAADAESHARRMASAESMRAAVADLHAQFDQAAADVPGPVLALAAAPVEDFARVTLHEWSPSGRVLPAALPPAPNDPPLPVEAEALAVADLEHAQKVPTADAAGLAVVGPGKLGTRVLDWASDHDERSLGYVLHDRLSEAKPLAGTAWPHGPILDQGTTPPLSEHDASGCVGYGVAAAANFLRARSGGKALTELDAHELYVMAQDRDAVSGRDYPGTSVRAGMAAGVAAGLWDGYGWCLGTRDIAQALLIGLPVVLGLAWPSALERPDANGVIRPGGAGGLGHCLTAVNLRLTLAGRPGPWFVLQQSRGVGHGDGGLVYVHHRDLADLLAGQGEAAVPLTEAWEPKA